MSKKASPISAFTIKIELRKNDIEMGTGTGFIYYHPGSGGHFLITNYHIATGRDPKNPTKTVNNYPDSPDELMWRYIDKKSNITKTVSIDLCEAFSKGTGLEHRDREKGVDIAALGISLSPDQNIWAQTDLVCCSRNKFLHACTTLQVPFLRWRVPGERSGYYA